MIKIRHILFLSFLVCHWCGAVWAARIPANDDGQRKHGDQTCGTTQNHRLKRHDRAVFPRAPPSGNKYGRALEFDKGQVVRYVELDNPSKKFGVDFWMKPEGGQNNHTVVLGVFDKCASANDETHGWFIGLREASRSSDLRITFTLHTASAHRNTSVMSHRKIDVRRWVHVAATYDGRQMKLYVNQAKVAVGRGQKGMVFERAMQGQPCDHLELGGDARQGHYYRGQIDKLRYWNDAISQRELTASIPDNSVNVLEKQHMFDDFDDETRKKLEWEPIQGGFPKFVPSTVPEEKHDLSIKKPPCGMTICDNPEIVRSYLENKDIRGHKRLRFRVINVMEDDGSRPMVTDDKVRAQYELVQEIFAPYNISWELEVVPVKDTWLRDKTVLHNCETAQVGDGTCNEDCSYDVTGKDGGDCPSPLFNCPPEKLGNRVCDPECNKGYYEWDKGDCCISKEGRTTKTCYNPNSLYRAYVSLNDYKKRIGLDNRDALNVYVADWGDTKLQGIATFAWEKNVHTVTGGVVLPPSHLRMKNISKVLVHELGHVLGLWHVHHGSASEMECASDCFESFPSLELGDLCEDTNPTILNTECGDPTYPQLSSQLTCGLPQYHNTPFKNYMGYANDSCTDNFTPQQVARMHCYIDQDYQSWQTNVKPSFIPLPPRITSQDEDSIRFSWIPPLGPGGNNARNLCNDCEENKVLEQYASTAYSPMPSKPTGNNAPHQATGFPDAEHCNVNPLAWNPDTVFVDDDDPDIHEKLYIEVGFKEAVVPTAITIWVCWGANNAFSDIKLIYTDGSVESIGNGTAQCDSPYTKPLYVEKKVSKVRIHISQAHTSIDAVKLISDTGHPNCSKCESLRYVISRKPPFDTGAETEVDTTYYEDGKIAKTGRYEYRVRAVTDEGLSGPFSPPLIYIPENGFCGDGKPDKGEECDDGNIRDGDGCNVQCQKEDVFHCNGHPSLCYRHDGDGDCEDFERKTSIKDCGFYTPDGFKDQWVHTAKANPKYIMHNEDCPADVVIGEPRPDLKCAYPRGKCASAWNPPQMDRRSESKDRWIEVSFKRPVVASAIIIYLVHIEYAFDFDGKTIMINLELMDSNGEKKMALEQTLTNVCKESPLTIPISHNMNEPFFKTQRIKLVFTNSENIGIAAVSLRSPKHFDPVELQSCESTELFHPIAQKCHQYKLCNMPECPKLIVKHSHSKCKKGKREGDICNVQCENGFTPRKPFQAICVRGEWLVDGEPPLCTPVDCRLPILRNAKPDCRDGTTFGKKCVFKCNKPAMPVGPGADPSITCEEDGLWSASNIFCQNRCLTPQIPSHASAPNKICMKSKVFDVGFRCKYRCDAGYIVTGLRQDSLFQKTCMKDGKWSGPRCTPIRCPISEKEQDYFKWYNCTSKKLYGSVCTLKCPDEENNREIRCKADRKWDKTFQMCPTKGACQLPVNSLKGPDINCNAGMKPGDKCQVVCPDGFQPGIKLKSKRQLTDSISCSPMFHWHPDLGTIKCLIKCKTNAIGDGYCDGHNNNEDCNWDGGDCCDSTSEDGEATRIFNLCGHNCTCQDPNAHDIYSGEGPAL